MAAAAAAANLILPTCFSPPPSTLLPRRSPHLIPSTTPLISHHHRHRAVSPFRSHKNPCFVPLAASLSSQNWSLDEAEEEMDAGNHGFDWGQQEEFSDEEAQGGPAEEAETVDGYGTTNAAPSLKLFVGNLPFGVDSERLAQLFGRAGDVEVAEVIYDRGTDRSRGFGFVTMCDSLGSEKAINMFHQYEVDGRHLTVNIASPRGSRPIQSSRSHSGRSHKIYVGNLPWQVDNARLEEVFAELGEVLDARIVYDCESGRSRGFGFVRMSLESNLEDVVAALNGKNLDGRSIRVDVAAQKP